MTGEEVSFFALVDGETVLPVRLGAGPQAGRRRRHRPQYRRHGRLQPGLDLHAGARARALDEIVRPTAQALAEAGTPFSGILYAGLMLTAEGPKLVEYNVRFGDPECQALMLRLDSDLLALMLATRERRAGRAPSRRASRTRPRSGRGHGREGLSRHARKGRRDRRPRPAGRQGLPRRHRAQGRQAGRRRRPRARRHRARQDRRRGAGAPPIAPSTAIDFPAGFCRRDIGWREIARLKGGALAGL